MPLLRSLFLLVVALLVGPSSRASAQQNLFNVPSANATPAGGVFVQEQVNVVRTAATSSTTVNVGFGHGLDVGFDVFDVAFYEPRAHDLPMVLLANAQAVYDPLPDLRLSLGTQQGVSTTHGYTRWAGFGWVSVRYAPHGGRAGRYLVGTYAASVGYSGPGNRVGGLLGVEVPLVGEHFALVADWFVGRNDVSVAVLGFQAGLGAEARTMLSLGAQLPSPGSHASYGAVLELTFVPPGEHVIAPPPALVGAHPSHHGHGA